MGTTTQHQHRPLPRPFAMVGVAVIVTTVTADAGQDWILARWWATALFLMWCILLVCATFATSTNEP